MQGYGNDLKRRGHHLSTLIFSL